MFGDVLVRQGRIEKIASSIDDRTALEINAEALWLMPGAIDDQVHFREPGLTHKAEIYTEARAAVAGGITSYMEMPNTIPNTFTQELLEQKYQRASEVSLANYSFFMGASNDNLEEVLKTDGRKVCGIKVFMGSSTGNMLVDNPVTLEHLFSEVPLLIATHCEDEHTIQSNLTAYKQRYGNDIKPEMHPLIRSTEACYLSSSLAISLAKKYGTRLHILHISTAKETALFDASIPVSDKKITAEACVHHLWFDDRDYATKGNLIKWNPAVKTSSDREAILQALLSGAIDIIATDHAPHTFEEKMQPYLSAPSGGPLVQHSVLAMMEMVHNGKITKEQVVEKMCHNPAVCFQLKERGYIREGYYADLVLVNPDKAQTVTKESLLYKCAWSPFEGHTFQSTIQTTFVNGHKVYDKGRFDEQSKGMRMEFSRSD